MLIVLENEAQQYHAFHPPPSEVSAHGAGHFAEVRKWKGLGTFVHSFLER